MTPEQAMKIQEARMKADDRRWRNGMLGGAALLAVMVGAALLADAGGLLLGFVLGGAGGLVWGFLVGLGERFNREAERGAVAGDWQRAQQAEAAD